VRNFVSADIDLVNLPHVFNAYHRIGIESEKKPALPGLTAQSLRVAVVERRFFVARNKICTGVRSASNPEGSQRHNSWAIVFTKKVTEKLGVTASPRACLFHM
jgi:hypothetical protein